MQWSKRKYTHQGETFDVYEIHDFQTELNENKPYLIGSSKLFDFINTKIMEDVNYLDLLITNENGGTLKLCELNDDIIIFDDREEAQTDEEFVKQVYEDIQCFNRMSILNDFL